jgi:hypothetical protein
MSNPNTQKLGKRKMPPGMQPSQPSWLFSAAGKETQPNPNQSKKSKNQGKKIAEDLLKRRAAGESAISSPPAQLVQYVFYGAYCICSSFIMVQN